MAEQDVGTFKLPEGHLFGTAVPKGGSNCAKCTFVSEDGSSCSNMYFQDWQASLKVEDPSKLPEPSDRYCCDVFDAKTEKTARVAYIKEEHGEYCVHSESNPDWSGGCYPSKEKAEERLRQVEFFKHKGASDLIVRVALRFLGP